MDDLLPWPENADELRARPRSETWGHLIDGSPFAAIFPDRLVPLRSIWPIIPREAGTPRCYLVAVEQLTEVQIQALAALLWQQWQPECMSVERAADYIRTEGLPLRTSWFTGVGTRRMGLLNLP